MMCEAPCFFKKTSHFGNYYDVPDFKYASGPKI